LLRKILPDRQGGLAVAKPLLDEQLWRWIEPLLPKPKRRRRRSPGRKPVADRKALTGILFVLRTGLPWEYLPREMGCGSGMTCWRRLRDWQRAGVWDRLFRKALCELNGAGKIDWSRGVVDSTSVRAVHGGKKREKTPWTGPSRARNTTGWSTRTARHWRRSSPAPRAA
jgi:transposase